MLTWLQHLFCVYQNRRHSPSSKSHASPGWKFIRNSSCGKSAKLLDWIFRSQKSTCSVKNSAWKRRTGRFHVASVRNPFFSKGLMDSLKRRSHHATATCTAVTPFGMLPSMAILDGGRCRKRPDLHCTTKGWVLVKGHFLPEGIHEAMWKNEVPDTCCQGDQKKVTCFLGLLAFDTLDAYHGNLIRLNYPYYGNLKFDQPNSRLAQI